MPRPIDYLSEYQADWLIRGRAPKTVCEYVRHLSAFLNWCSEPSKLDVLSWLSQVPSSANRRQVARAFRSFGKYLESSDHHWFEWWRELPLAREVVVPQPTATLDDLRFARTSCQCPRERALIEVLWSTGMRRSEIAGLLIEDVVLEAHLVQVRKSKTGIPRRAPLSQAAEDALRAHIGRRESGKVFELSAEGISALLRRRGLMPAHAWRRGWAVNSLRSGVSEASVRTVAGWRSGAMVVRYAAALSEELAIEEFRRCDDGKGKMDRHLDMEGGRNGPVGTVNEAEIGLYPALDCNLKRSS